MADIFFGEIEGFKEGAVFKDRADLTKAGLHRPLVAGIDGNPREGASSIVLNGGYVDDMDLGDEIIYTGHGGNNPDTHKQIADQSWDDTGNKALLVSEMQGLPVRVTRGAKHKSPYSPKTGYRYAGLYQVTDHNSEIGRDGFHVCRYRLQKIGVQEITEFTTDKELPAGNKELKRISSTVLRIVRDNALSRSIKELYDYTCQVCGTKIEVRGIPYAEGAHIKPLGKPHNGEDIPENILCLCPNHHVMFDKGGFSIKEDHTLFGLIGSLKTHRSHKIDSTNLIYHQNHIYINSHFDDSDR